MRGEPDDIRALTASHVQRAPRFQIGRDGGERRIDASRPASVAVGVALLPCGIVRDAPRFLAYLDTVLPRHPELQPLAELIETRVRPAMDALEQPLPA